MLRFFSIFGYTVKHVLSDHSKIDKPMLLKIDGSLMHVESIAKCSRPDPPPPWKITKI